METFSFGRTGLKVSKLCFGTMTLGSSKWKPWVRVEAGSIIYRPVNGAEGKRPGNEPMLALYAWLSQ